MKSGNQNNKTKDINVVDNIKSNLLIKNRYTITV